LLMWFLKNVIKSKQLFHVPQGENDKPPILIRLLLITTCTLVSFFHGSNDGQKGVGLLMLILIAFLPAKFAMNNAVSNDKISTSLTVAAQSVQNTLLANPQKQDTIATLSTVITKAKEVLAANTTNNPAQIFKLRKQIQSVVKGVKALTANTAINISAADRTALTATVKELTNVTDYAPTWVIALISISLGIGTMIGWKRIVVTIGEKIGKEHLNYAQGATAEIVAAATIGLSTGFGLPVSTTHVLSSGVAGAMVASNGSKNLNSGTLKNIALAWVLTLPVSIILSLALFALFHLFI
jgi:PiT family inorganic phosphate transporter